MAAVTDIPGWLKTLRLHKYSSLFDGMTWADMLKLDDEKLQALGMSALGARYVPDRARRSSLAGEGANGDLYKCLTADTGVIQPKTT